MKICEHPEAPTVWARGYSEATPLSYVRGFFGHEHGIVVVRHRAKLGPDRYHLVNVLQDRDEWFEQGALRMDVNHVEEFIECLRAAVAFVNETTNVTGKQQ